MKKFYADAIRRLPIRLYLLVAAVVCFAFFSNDFGLVDIQKTALILAAGVDRTQSGFTLTAQIANPKGSGAQQDNSGLILKGSGKTVSDCVAQIYAETGWVPKLIYCDLVVLGRETAQTDVFDCLDFFLRNEYMSDSCLLALCEGSAEELILSSSAADDTSADAVSKIFSEAAEKSGKLSKTTLKEFSIGYYGASQSGFMPFLRAVPAEETQNSGGSSESAGGSGGSSESAGGASRKETFVYLAQETALFLRGVMVGLLSPEETFAYRLLSGDVYSGMLSVAVDGEDLSLTVLKNDGDASLDMKAAPKAKLSVQLTVRLYDRDKASPIEDVALSETTDKAQKAAEELLSSYVGSLWEKIRQSQCDLFLFRRSLYRSSPKKFREWDSTLLNALRPETQISVRGVE